MTERCCMAVIARWAKTGMSKLQSTLWEASCKGCKHSSGQQRRRDSISGPGKACLGHRGARMYVINHDKRC